MAEVVIVPHAEAGAQLAAERIALLVSRRPRARLGIATGGTPERVYAELARRSQAGLDFSRVRAFALDEYVGIDPTHPASYHHVIRTQFTEPLGADPSRVHVPDGDPARLTTTGERYERRIRRAGGIDLQLLGIGRTGHLGFNEPGSSFASRTRVKTLSRMTRDDNLRFFPDGEEVPLHCVTQGLGTILDARELLLLAFGEAKADILAAAVEGPVTASVPGSVIQWHPRVCVVADEAAASRLAERDYYRFAWDNRPAALAR